MGANGMKQITFKQAKPNHYYAIRNEKGQLELVKEPQKGQEVFEFAAVAGGSQ